MPKLKEFLFGKKDKAKKFDTLTGGQMDVLNQLLAGLQGQGGAFGGMFGEFDPTATANMWEQGVAAPAMRNFQQRVIPSIMQSFADQGASSGLSNSLATAGRDMEENLNAQLAQYMWQAQMQQQQNRMAGLGLGLGTKAFQPYVQQGYAGMIPGFLQSFGEGAGYGLGKQFGSGIGGGNAVGQGYTG